MTLLLLFAGGGSVTPPTSPDNVDGDNAVNVLYKRKYVNVQYKKKYVNVIRKDRGSQS